MNTILKFCFLVRRKQRSVGSPNAAAILVKSMMFYFTMNLEVFVYCSCGEYLNAKVSAVSALRLLVYFLQSKMIGDAAYGTRWYDFLSTESWNILFIIVRSQK